MNERLQTLMGEDCDEMGLEYTWDDMEKDLREHVREAVTAYCKANKDHLRLGGGPDARKSEWLLADDPVFGDHQEATEEGWEGTHVVLLRDKDGNFITTMAQLGTKHSRWESLGNTTEAGTVDALKSKLQHAVDADERQK